MSDADELQALVGRTLLGRYRIDALLGMGGMGGVFRAHHLGLAHDVALKVLRPGMRTGNIAPARFEREARSASRLDHPHCVRVTDFGELEDGTKFLVMELLDGVELKSRLGAPWRSIEAIDVALQILAGLEHAHARGVVHRDLKPENVLLTSEGHVKLVDFGIAKLLEDDAGPKLTRTGMLFGTPRYMSPEQAGGGTVDARTDLYAVGLLLYEMLAGRPPFMADDVASIMRMHVLTPPPALTPSVPAALGAVVMKLLAKSRADRFASATEAIAALATIRRELAGETVPTIEAPPATGHRITSKQLVVGGLVLAVLWLAVIVVAIAWPTAQPPTPTPTPTPPPAAKPRAPAPAPAVVPRPSCEGDPCECGDPQAEDCDFECEGHSACTFRCGDDCEVECGGRTECTLEVGDESKVECGGQSRCAVTCRADCVVECHGGAQCELQCLDARGSPPNDCDKDSRACGPCR